MYTDNDLQEIRAQIKRREIGMLIPGVALLAGVVVTLILRMEWATTLCTCLLGGMVIFFYDLLLKPLCCYERHVKGVLQGRTHEIEGMFKGMDGEVSQVEGVAYHSILVQVGDAKNRTGEDDRLFYFDCEKPFPDLTEGDRVKVTYHDREVAALVKLS